MSIKSQIERALISLRSIRPVFHSEDDFKFALSTELLKLYHDIKIRLEVPKMTTYKYLDYGQGAKDPEDVTVYIDMMIYYASRKYAVELKYRTKKTEVIKDGDEEFKLKDHSARDVGRYKFRADISRLEYLKRKGLVKNGYAIFLTNEPLFWNQPIEKKYMDGEFRLGGPRFNKKAKWNLENDYLLSHYINQDGILVGKQSGKKNWIFTPEYTKDLSLNGEYKINWKDYSSEHENSIFKYLMIEV